MWFAIMALVAVICIILFAKQSFQNDANKSQDSSFEPSIPAGTFDLHNLPDNVTDSERDFLYKVAVFNGVRYITEDHIRAYNLDTMNRLFQSMSGWNEWDASVHQVEGQYERMARTESDDIEILSYDKQTKIGRVIGSKGDIYTTTYQGCDCPDFQFRHLPCKHMYTLAMALDGNVDQDI